MVPRSMSGSPIVAISQSSTATICVKSAGSRTRLSNLKSLWIKLAPADSAGRFAASQSQRPLEVGDVVGPGVLVALGPAGDLALDVALRLAEVAQPGRAVVERVQLGQRSTRVSQSRRTRLGVDRAIGSGRPAQDDPAPPLHQVKRRAEDRSRPRNKSAGRGAGA